eukprot:3200214-Pyramimonas_sp.AAC.1
MHKVLPGKGAGALDLMKTPPGHLALEADEYEMATEDQGSMSFTITANPPREEAPLLFKDVSDPEPIAGALAVNDPHAYMMSQEYEEHQSLYQRRDVRFRDPGVGEQRLEDMASWKY